MPVKASDSSRAQSDTPTSGDDEPSDHDCVLDEVEIREMELEDISPIYQLGEEVFTSDRWPQLHRTWDEYEVVEAFMHDRETSLVAVLNGRVVGFALGVLIAKRHSSWVYGYLEWLAVDPELGRRGVAKLLIKDLRALFIEAGARMLLVDTHADNEPALNFFRRQGFGSEEDHVYLSLNLTHEKDYLKFRAKKKG